MGDFLQQLAERALGVAPAVWPRPASRFEPQPVEELEARRGRRPRLPAHRGDGPPAAVPVAGPEPSRQSSPAAKAASGSRDSVGAGAKPPPARPARSPAPREAARPDAATRDAPSLSGAADRAVGRPGDLARPERGLEGTAVRTQRPRRAALATSVPEAHGSEPPPVHVTIDRIEVRAVAPSPQRASAKPRRPEPLSLDEYLEHRRSGRR
jgi:hypothetical protein